jgi:nucleoside phosphorylase
VPNADLGHRPIVRQELVVHVFAPADGPRATDSYARLRALWSACAQRFGPVRSIAGVAFATALPDSPSMLPTMTTVAGQQGADTGFQAVLRREHDVVNLSVALAPTRADTNSPGWIELDRRWDRLMSESTDDFLGEARLYLGQLADPGSMDASPRLADSVAHALSLPDRAHLDGGLRTTTGFAIWEVAPTEDGRQQRRIAVLASDRHHDELSAWTWSRGDAAMPPFARYLMHAAVIRYELRVRDKAEAVAGARTRLDTDTAELHRLLDSFPADGPPPDGRRAARRRLTGLRVDQVRVALLASQVRDMRRTVQIARDNMVAVVERQPTSEVAERTVLVDDRALAEWFVTHLEDDAANLEAASARAVTVAEVADAVLASDRESTQAVRPTFGVVTALPEEFAAVHMLLDEPTRQLVDGDRADYVIGTMPSLVPGWPHVVVLTLLGDTANDPAAESCANLIRSFRSVDQIVMVGIAAGVPNPRHPERHVRLGDIVVATWGIVDYDHVMETPDGPVPRQPFPRPSALLARRAKMLEVMDLLGERPWEQWLNRITTQQADFHRPAEATDIVLDEEGRTLAHPSRTVTRHRGDRPKVHYGLVGSADRGLRNARVRDSLADRHELRAVEMEGKGIGNAAFAGGREWLVVRGISDYGDSGTDKRWRGYASATAAAYLRALLAQCPPIRDHGGHTRAPDD